MEQIRKILIIGSKGMAGHVIYHYLRSHSDFVIIDIARNNDYHTPSYQLSVTDFGSLTKILETEKPNYVINCIGILNNEAEENPDNAILLNSYFPHFLARMGSILDFKLIHISTDCVFNGKTGGYTEHSEKNGVGFYAQTKSLGEVTYGNNLTLRTSIIGPELKKTGIGLFHWFMQQCGTIRGYRNAYWTGVTTIELAKAILSAIEKNISGLHHLVYEKKINKYDLIILFKKIFKMGSITIEPYDEYNIDKSLIKTNDLFDYKVPSYSSMVKEMRHWIETHPELYSHYLSIKI